MFESIPIVQILICLISGALVISFSFLRRASGFLVLSLLGIALVYRQLAVGYVLINVIVLLFVTSLARITANSDAKRRLRWRWSCAALIALVVAFIVGRWYQIETKGLLVGGIEWSLFSVDMWLLLRLVTFLWEFGSGRIAQPSLLTFAIWTCMPFTVFGPLLRYSQFESQLPFMREAEVARAVYTRTWVLNALRATALLVCGITLSRLHATMFASGTQGVPYWIKLLDSFGISPWSFLLTWWGFYKLMECLALMWSVSLPPSFNAPFGRPNISEFWANWNMTATSVFRDYLFYTRWGQQRVNLYLNTLIIFFLVGLWHGANWYWVIWGMLHGIGFCCFIWYRHRRASKQFETNGATMRILGPILTYVFVCSCWILPSRILKVLGQI
ncbi:MAG: hypothetical protein AUG51_10380 [Acidobacteria bacterium 13_1_20CM_3_53_8]|nr:MAG: hypothetical protein AUG51_10380 [Acidobacteria bacterium 13_1_20CM_3_53_8]